MGEALIQRDERGRIVGLTIQSAGMSESARRKTTYLLKSVSEALSEYLHVPVESSFDEDMNLAIDRGDQHLDREIDAILATVGSGLRIVEREHPAELMVKDATVSVEV